MEDNKTVSDDKQDSVDSPGDASLAGKNDVAQDLDAKAVPAKDSAAAEELPSWLNDSRPTPAIKALLFLNVVTYIAMTVTACSDIATASSTGLTAQSLIEVLISMPSDALLAWGANAATATVLDHQYWRLLTNTFLHVNLLHLGMNMYILWDFNRLLERLYGSSKFLVIYLLSGLGSSICSLLFLDPSNISAGASGAIYGIFGATVAFFWAFRKEFPKKFFRMYQKMFFIFLIYCVVSSQMFPGMDTAAHLGGFIVGLWTALCVLPSKPASQSWAKGNFLKLSCLTLVLVVGLELDIRMNRDNPRVQGEREYQRAIKLLKHERFEEALIQLKKAAEITPQNAAIFADEAQVNSRLKRYPASLAAAARALQLDPKNRKATAMTASAFHNMGEEQKAIDENTRLIQIDPRSSVAYNNRAWGYVTLNLPDRGIADSTRALQLDAQNASAYDTRGMAYCLKGQYQLALHDFATYVRLKPKEGGVYYHRSYANFAAGKNEEAKKDLARAKASSYQLEPWEAKQFQELLKL